MIDFEAFRRPAKPFKRLGSIDLCEVASSMSLQHLPNGNNAMKYLMRVESNFPIYSRQAAAVAIATAEWIACQT